MSGFDPVLVSKSELDAALTALRAAEEELAALKDACGRSDAPLRSVLTAGQESEEPKRFRAATDDELDDYSGAGF